MTSLVRFASPEGGWRVGVLHDGAITPLAVESMGDLLSRTAADMATLIEGADAPTVALADTHLATPIDGRTPVWAAGVTYTISRDARIEESEVEDVYAKVYDADRPELFYKAASWEVMTDGDSVGRRDDSVNDTPEPELGLVVNAHREIVAYTVCNDMSSRSIEGENPLYLPQAKMFAGSCVVAPTLRLASEIENPLDLTIRMRITRQADVIFDGEASTSRLHRSLDELVGYLTTAQRFPEGVILSTGTCLVPALDAPVLDGDIVEITIDGVGAIANVVTPTSTILS